MIATLNIKHLCLPLMALFTSMTSGCGDDEVIRSGTYKNLAIQSSMDQALEQLKKDGISELRPEVDIIIKAKASSRENLATIFNYPGICITNNSGIFIKLRLNAATQSIEVIEWGGRQNDEVEILKAGASKMQAIAAIEKFLLEDKRAIASNCIPESRRVNPQELNRLDRKYIKSYNTWFYYEPNSYSYNILLFEDGRLTEIRHYSRPTETL